MARQPAGRSLKLATLAPAIRGRHAAGLLAHVQPALPAGQFGEKHLGLADRHRRIAEILQAAVQDGYVVDLERRGASRGKHPREAAAANEDVVTLNQRRRYLRTGFHSRASQGGRQHATVVGAIAERRWTDGGKLHRQGLAGIRIAPLAQAPAGVQIGQDHHFQRCHVEPAVGPVLHPLDCADLHIEKRRHCRAHGAVFGPLEPPEHQAVVGAVLQLAIDCPIGCFALSGLGASRRRRRQAGRSAHGEDPSAVDQGAGVQGGAHHVVLQKRQAVL